MVYHFTILNIAAGLLLAFVLLGLIFNYKKLAEGEGWGVVAMFGLLGLVGVTLFVDFQIQLLTQYLPFISRVLVENLLSILALIGFYYYNRAGSRRSEFIVPDNFLDCTAIVYGIPGTPRLKTNLFTLNRKGFLPEDGVLFTSSPDIHRGLGYVDFYKRNGKRLPYGGSFRDFWSDKISLKISDHEPTFRVINLNPDLGEKEIKRKVEEVKERIRAYFSSIV